MARTIAVSEEVYALLKKNKLPNESFSKVIKRSIKPRVRLLDIAGSKILTREDWKEAEKQLRKSERNALKKMLDD
jgi:predicted CopG family antitoxin